MEYMVARLKQFVLLGFIITTIFGTIDAIVQQNYRQSANDPQIQMSEDIATQLNGGQNPSTVFPTTTVNIDSSLAPFIIIYDLSGQPRYGNARLNKNTPTVPLGVLNYAKEHGQNRITWQPQNEVRSAIVVTPYKQGFVLVGRSLREVEIREKNLTTHIFLAWLITISGTFIGTMLLLPKRKK